MYKGRIRLPTEVTATVFDVVFEPSSPAGEGSQTHQGTRRIGCHYPYKSPERVLRLSFWIFPFGQPTHLCLCKSMFVDREHRTLAVARSFNTSRLPLPA